MTVPDELLLVPMDATLMEQVLLNLLENAALHGGRVKNITLTARRRNDKAELRVEDDGVGLDSHGLESVFDGMRTRAEQTSSDRRNMGIGLTVCRTIVNAHGGQITAANRPQGGASFCITLPLAEIEEEEHDELDPNRRGRIFHQQFYENRAGGRWLHRGGGYLCRPGPCGAGKDGV